MGGTGTLTRSALRLWLCTNPPLELRFESTKTELELLLVRARSREFIIAMKEFTYTVICINQY